MPLEQATYPHPHVDPRQPRDKAVLQCNPPVFAWKPETDTAGQKFTLVVATDAELKDRILEEPQLENPLFLPPEALEPGTYYWSWTTGGQQSAVHSFEIPENALCLEVPMADAWLKAFSGEHPRFLFKGKPGPDLLESLQAREPDSVDVLFKEAERILGESHHMEEPPYRGDRYEDYERYRKIQYTAMWGSRKFAIGAQTMALAYTLGGNRDYGRAAAKRLASLAKWDPFGSTHIESNDEPHMSVIWYGAVAADWAWDCFTGEEKVAFIEQMQARARITFEHMHDRGQYGITRFDSHAGREIIFLANLLFVFHEYIPEAESWLNWLRPILCGIWPIWAENDGSWAEGVSYSLAYVNIMTLFASALKRGTGIDLYRKPFWKNYARWRMACMPPYAEWIGFGDHCERWPVNWMTSANTIELIGRETGTSEFESYIGQLREEIETMPPTPPERELVPVSPQLLLCPASPKERVPAKTESGPVLQSFADAGWAAFRSKPTDASKDIALVFRSSPYGSISHSHANNNDFILHAGGVVLTMPSGYYSGYASPHHAHWVWHTQSNNCVTLSGAPQLMRSPDSRGEILGPYEDEELATVLGNADESYADRASRCRRHVVYFKKAGVFLLVDDFLPKPGVVSSFQWNLHSWAPFNVEEAERIFSLEREAVTLTGHILYHRDGFFSLTEGWDPPFKRGIQNSDQWKDQYHLRFTPTPLVGEPDHGVPSMRFGVLLAPSSSRIKPAVIEARVEDGVEIAEFGDVRIEFRIVSDQDDVATIRCGNRQYRLGPSGIEPLD
jgi:hypothetical protein